MSNPFKTVTKKELTLWIGSVLVILLSNIVTREIDGLMLVAAIVGVTSLILAAIGNLWAQILMVLFERSERKEPEVFAALATTAHSR